MEIQVNQSQNLLPISEASVQEVVDAFITSANVNFDEVSIHFVDNALMCALHADYFDDPSPTDCISFPMDDADSSGYRVMGDIFVCPETAIKYVQENGGIVYEEVTLYLIHGLLHLIGYDDQDDADRQIMRDMEAFHLKYLRKKEIWIHP